MTHFVGKDGKGKDIRFIQYDGLNYPVGVVNLMDSGQNLQKQLETCRALKVRDDDVFIPAFLKSGTFILYMYLSFTINIYKLLQTIFKVLCCCWTFITFTSNITKIFCPPNTDAWMSFINA